MTVPYTIIEIYTSEESRYNGKPAWQAVIDVVAGLTIAARAIVTKGFAGCNESGEITAPHIEVLLYNLPVKIEIVFPSSERDTLLPKLEAIVEDGIVLMREQNIYLHKTRARLLPRHIKVKDVMTANPSFANQKSEVKEIIQVMLKGGFNGVPVVNSQQQPIGIITQGDLLSRASIPLRLGLLGELASEQVDDLLHAIAHKPVKELMTSPVKTVLEDMYLNDAIFFMLKNKLKRVPVVNPQDQLSGMLSRLDIFRFITHETPSLQTWAKHHIQTGQIQLVKDIMQRDTRSVLPDTPIEEIIPLIFTNENHRVAVTDAGNKLLGIISSRDIFARFSEKQPGLWQQILAKIPLLKSSPFLEEMIKAAEAHTAADVMHAGLITVTEENPDSNSHCLDDGKTTKTLAGCR